MKILLCFFILLSQNIFAKTYETPPSSRSGINVPYISDEAMEMCVKLYNEAKWLKDEIQQTTVDRYSQNSIDNYNSKISKHSKMINDFNNRCAGKQSESAYRAAQKLNKNQGGY